MSVWQPEMLSWVEVEKEGTCGKEAPGLAKMGVNNKRWLQMGRKELLLLIKQRENGSRNSEIDWANLLSPAITETKIKNLGSCWGEVFKQGKV